MQGFRPIHHGGHGVAVLQEQVHAATPEQATTERGPPLLVKSIMPGQNMHFSLIGPVFHIRTQTGAHRIMTHVIPFL